MEINAKNLLLMSLARYYRGENTITQIVGIINSKSRISLRLLDWHVTNYSKKNSTNVIAENGSMINIYVSYRSQLKAYSKSRFDPFRRKARLYFYYEKDSFIETTIGQLNFFRWILQNNILKFLLQNLETIERDMLTSHALKRSPNPEACDERESRQNEGISDRIPVFLVNFN